ncbi:MAG: serine racemase VanT catalytic subunit [Clostridiales bacterium]|nr:serine racemase VanT catalytic subunit [Clostridiales bacterium]
MWRNHYQKKATGTGRAWIELDMVRLLHNVGILRSILPGTCQLMPAVKANAYGHGAAVISRELNRLGVSAFCVASAVEGVELRKKKIKGEILVLGYTDPEQFHLLRRYRLMQTVIDYGYAKKLNALGKRITVHIKVDTGMRRLGEPAESVENILKILKCENLVIAGIYSHFSAQDSGDPVDCAITQSQIDGFNNVLSRIREEGFDIPKAHIQNSYGVFARPDLTFDYARVGIALYGAYQSSRGEAGALLPVLSLKARVSAVKAVRAGETVGYGRAFAAGRDMKIAVLSIGYADGIPRAFSCGVGRVLINGKPAPIVGCVCMDQTTVDVTDIDGVMQGDVAVFIGRDGGAEISIMDFAEAAGTIPNEVLSRLGGRLERCVI